MFTILGKGQLGLMIRDAAEHLHVPHEWIDSLQHISPQTQCVTVESEFVRVEELEAAVPEGARFAPGYGALRVLQDKFEQKQLFQRLNIPTAKFRALDSPRDLRTSCVLKWSRLGYDGKGVLRTEPGDPRVASFFRGATEAGGRVYGEDLVSFDAEVATVATRTADGRIVHFPPVRTVQRDGVCSEVLSLPTTVPLLWLESARDAMKRLGDDQRILGTFAMEWFLVGPKILANECAPRVHNSGHVTLASTHVSQFEAHVRACLDLELREPQVLHPFSAMLNLLGPPGKVSKNPSPPASVSSTGFSLKWYGKDELRPGRKMGHLNVVADQATVFEIRLQQARRIVEQWANTG